MTKSPKILLFLLFFVTMNCLGQNRTGTDSLVSLLEQQADDSVRCRILLEIATVYHSNDTAVSPGLPGEGAGTGHGPA